MNLDNLICRIYNKENYFKLCYRIYLSLFLLLLLSIRCCSLFYNWVVLDMDIVISMVVSVIRL